MKILISTILLAGLIALGYSTKGQTNVYHPFPDSNAVQGISAGCTDPNCGDYSYIKYHYAGDTVIEGINYKKVVNEVLPLTSRNCCIVPGGLGAGFSRQDIAAKKVYWQNQWTNGDTLLYDFTLNVGATLNTYLRTETNKTLVTLKKIIKL